MKTETTIGKQLSRLAFGLLVIGTTSAQAVEVFGFKLGQPLAIPECEKVSGHTFGAETDPCFEKYPYERYTEGGPNIIYLHFPNGQIPKMIHGTHIECMLIEGKLEAIKFSTSGLKDIERVLAALTAKYGKPLSIERPVVQNAMGAQYEDLDAQWDLPNLFVRFRGLSESITSGWVIIRTDKGRAEYSRRYKPKPDPRPL